MARERVDFDDYASSYEEEIARALPIRGAGHDYFLEAKARHFAVAAGRRLGGLATRLGLDLGCGTGAMTRLLTPLCRRVLGTDVALSSLAEARRQAPHARYGLFDGSVLPYREATFDFALAVCVFHHVPPEERAELLEEMVRVVRPGGMVAIYEHNPLNPFTRLVVARCAFDRDAVLIGCRAMRRLVSRAGLRDVSCSYMLLSPWRGIPGAAIERALGRFPLGAQYSVFGIRPGA